MPSTPLTSALAYLHDAATNPDLWREALPLIATALDGVGAACFASNDLTGGVEWAYLFGPAAAHKTDYLEHYATADLYTPLLSASGQAGWQALSECLPEHLLNNSAWYQEFVRPSSISDVVGIQLYHAGLYRVFFGVHYPTVQPTLASRNTALQELLGPLQEVARAGYINRTFNLKSLFSGSGVVALEG